MTFRKDLGSSIIATGLSQGEQIVIAENFTPLNLVLYPDGLSSITANIQEMIVTFDFRDEILKIFLFIFQEYKLIEKASLSEKIRQQTTSPIVISFTNLMAVLQINGLVLTCELGESDSSQTTAENFAPLIITQAKIVKTPVGVMVSRYTEVE